MVVLYSGITVMCRSGTAIKVPKEVYNRMVIELRIVPSTWVEILQKHSRGFQMQRNSIISYFFSPVYSNTSWIMISFCVISCVLHFYHWSDNNRELSSLRKSSMEAVEALKISEHNPTCPKDLKEYILSKNNGPRDTGWGYFQSTLHAYLLTHCLYIFYGYPRLPVQHISLISPPRCMR